MLTQSHSIRSLLTYMDQDRRGGMSREHIGPMERHPGHPETIEQHARELSHLAEQALRVEATTDRTFEAATAHWEGLGGVRAADRPVTGEAARRRRQRGPGLGGRRPSLLGRSRA